MEHNGICHLFVESFAGDQDDGFSGYGVIVTDSEGNTLHLQSGAFGEGPDSGSGGAYGARIRAYELGCRAARMLGIKKCVLHSDPDIADDTMYAAISGKGVVCDGDGDPDYFGIGVFTAPAKDGDKKDWWDEMSVEAAGMSGRALGAIYGSGR